MSASLSIPASEMTKLRTQLRAYAQYSKKSEAEIVNDKAADWAFKAIGQTEKANAQKLAVELGQIGNKISVNKKTGAIRKGKRIFKDGSFAARILNARLAKKGEDLLFGEAMEKKVAKFIAARTRAVAFVKSGWLAAAKKIRPASSSEAKIRGKPKGTARRAPLNASIPTALIVNLATKDSPKAASVASEGLRKAIPIMIADMQTYIERKMKEAARKAGV